MKHLVACVQYHHDEVFAVLGADLGHEQLGDITWCVDDVADGACCSAQAPTTFEGSFDAGSLSRADAINLGQFDIAFYKIINESSTAVQLLKRKEMDIIAGKNQTSGKIWR